VMPRPATMSYIAVGGLISLLVANTVFAGQVHSYTTTMAAQLFAPEPYISTVVETPGKLSKPVEGH
jgi:multicomponent K+:H+ antiporter subunit D